MFRVGALLSIVLILAMLFGCSDKTSEAKPTGVEIAFANCVTFLANVFIDDNLVGQFSSERPWFIDVAAGSHTLYVESNVDVVSSNTRFCWTQDFSVSDNNTTEILLDCDGHTCPVGQ
jgi:hypothetical protein